MNMTNISEHPCANKCSEYKAEQCKSCLIQETKVQGVYVMGKADDMGDDDHIENHISPLCKQDLFGDANDMVDAERLQQWKNNIPKFAGFRASNLSKNESQSDLAIKSDAQIIAELKAENAKLHQAASTHLRNQMEYINKYHDLVGSLYPYALDLAEQADSSNNEYEAGYNRARECAHFNLMEMMESDIQYIKAYCEVL